jgi:hypothetical protein
MTKGLLKALTVSLALGAWLYPVLVNPHSLDPRFDCRSNAHTFIASLVNDQYINPHPMHVEANSVNAFRPAHRGDLTLFGFNVFAVLGYERDDAMFQKGSGTAIDGSLYGAVVSGPKDGVEARLRQAGSDAVVREVIPFLLTAIVCNKH